MVGELTPGKMGDKYITFISPSKSWGHLCGGGLLGIWILTMQSFKAVVLKALRDLVHWGAMETSQGNHIILVE